MGLKRITDGSSGMARKTLGVTTVEVLQSVASGTRYGFDIMDATGLPSGTVYPALSRLERMGLLRSRWEDPRLARREKRPPRKYYQLTSEGHRRLVAEARRFAQLQRSLSRGLRDLEVGLISSS
jgi:PadR family transcriptional regulator PadR